MTLEDVIRFADKRYNGAARVEFPLVVGCKHCDGVTGIRLAGLYIHDPELASQVSLVHQGFCLARNEESAAKGGFTNMGDEGSSDAWQCVDYRPPCSCEQAVAEKAA